MTMNQPVLVRSTSSKNVSDSGNTSMRMRQTMLNKPGFALSSQSQFNHPLYSTYFKLFDDVNGKIRLQCKVKENDDTQICGKLYTQQKTTFSNLIKHLKNQHNITPTTVEDKEHPKISDHLINQKDRNNHSIQKTFDYDVQNLICVDGVPPLNLELPGFASLILNLDKKIRIKSRRTYMRQIRAEVESNVIPSLKNCLTDVKPRYCHFSCDIWSSRRREGVLCVMVHFINDHWDLVSKVIGFKNIAVSHTAENIKNLFGEVLVEVGIDISKVGVVVTDNANNMKAFMNLLEVIEDDDTDISDEERDEESESESDVDGLHLCDTDSAETNDKFGETYSDDGCLQKRIFGHHGCLSHALQLAINKSILMDTTAHELLKYINSVMEFFKNSTKWTDELRGLTQLDIVKPVITRWNGLLDMLDRFQKKPFYNAVRDILHRVQDELFTPRQRQPHIPPTAECHSRMIELYNLLRPFGDATDIVQAEGPTSNNAIISIISAVERVVEVKQQHFILLKEQLLEQTKIRMNGVLADEDFILAAILDPRQKLDLFEHDTNEEECQTLDIPSLHKAESILTTAFFFETQKLGMSVTNPQPPDPHRKKTIYDPIKKPKSSLQTSQDSELEEYKNEGLIEGVESPLEYWARRGSTFPVLASLAKRYLAIPASTAGVERIFSISGALGRARRARMLSDTMRNVIMLREHRKPSLLKRLQELFGAKFQRKANASKRRSACTRKHSTSSDSP